MRFLPDNRKGDIEKIFKSTNSLTESSCYCQTKAFSLSDKKKTQNACK